MSISVLTVDSDATDVVCTDDALQVTLSDGRIISVPLAWAPRLSSATPSQRKNWRLIAGGVGIRACHYNRRIAGVILHRGRQGAGGLVHGYGAD